MKTLAPRIRALRRQQQRTLKDIAGRCGFTVSLLSKIESGKTSPPVATLMKIAEALGVDVADLMTSRRAHSTVLTPSAKLAERCLTPTDKGYGFHLFAPERPGKAMQPFLFQARRGAIKRGAMSHAGEEFVYVLEGRMDYRVGAEVHTLGPGDSLYFSSAEAHDLEPVTETVRYLAVFVEPPPGPAAAATLSAS